MGKRGRRERSDLVVRQAPLMAENESVNFETLRSRAAEASDRDRLLHQLRDLVDGIEQERRLVDMLVRRGRELGLSWTALGAALGVSAQAVHKRYGTRST